MYLTFPKTNFHFPFPNPIFKCFSRNLRNLFEKGGCIGRNGDEKKEKLIFITAFAHQNSKCFFLNRENIPTTGFPSRGEGGLVLWVPTPLMVVDPQSLYVFIKLPF